jgi:hypothetical protein
MVVIISVGSLAYAEITEYDGLLRRYTPRNDGRGQDMKKNLTVFRIVALRSQ